MQKKEGIWARQQNAPSKKVQNLVNGANSHTYLINMYDEEDNLVFTKIGKADNINKRFSALERQYYATQDIQIARIEPIYVFDVKKDKESWNKDASHRRRK